jgi:20S proteasome alpha/beta subunit
MEYNGGSVVAMVGKNCVAIASDLRLGNQALTVATNFEKVSVFISISGVVYRLVWRMWTRQSEWTKY